MKALTKSLEDAVARVTEAQKNLTVAQDAVVNAAQAHEEAVKAVAESYAAVKAAVKEAVPSVGSAPRQL